MKRPGPTSLPSVSMGTSPCSFSYADLSSSMLLLQNLAWSLERNESRGSSSHGVTGSPGSKTCAYGKGACVSVVVGEGFRPLSFRA